MSGLVLTPVSPTPEKSIERQGSTSESERPAERFDEVSAREKARLERKEARQDRADQRTDDNRIASRQAEQERLEESRAKQSTEDTKAEESRHAARTDEKTPEDGAPDASGKAENQAADGAGEFAEQDSVTGEEVLPMLFTVPSQPETAAAVKGLSVAANVQGSGITPTSGTMLDKLMMQPQQQGTGAGSGDSLLGMKGEQLGLLTGKAALGADGKTLDFSTQLARFQGSGDTSSLQNNATSLQRGLEGRESMATLKSYSTSVDLPVQHAQWGEKVAGKLAWLTSQRMSAAEIHITPPDLGPLEVRVQVQHDQAHVTVHATHSAVRDQLELNGHRLRDMLQENGLNLDKFEVSADASGQGQQQLAEDRGSGAKGSSQGAGAEVDVLDEPLAGGSLDLSWRGEVDLYA